MNDSEIAKPSGAFEAWEVRWTSRYGEYSGNTQPEMKVFPNRAKADAFANDLRKAFNLIKHTSQTEIYVKRNGE
jgi:hypothetical protein